MRDYENRFLLVHPLVKRAVKSVLIKSKFLIKNSSMGWTQNCLARDRSGCSISPQSNDAVSFSILGAVRAAEPHIRLQYLTILVLRQSVARLYKSCPTSIMEWNDNPETTYERILRVVDESIERVEA